VNYSLNDAYDDGSTVTVDGSAVTLAGSHATNNVFALTLTGSGTGNMIDIENSTTGTAGYDIIGTGDTWHVSSAGAITCVGITPGGDITSTATAIDWDLKDNDSAALEIDVAGKSGLLVVDTSTAAEGITMSGFLTVAGIVTGSLGFVSSDGPVSITDNSNAANGLNFTNDTVTTFGNATDEGPIHFTSATLSTGHLVTLSLDASELNGGSYLRCWEQDAGASVFTIGEDGATTIAGKAAGTTAVTISLGDLVIVDSDTSTISSVNGTATLLTLDNAGGAIGAGEAVLSIDAGGVVNAAGFGLDVRFTGAAAAGATVVNVVADAGSVGQFINCGGVDTREGLKVDADPTAYDVVLFHSDAVIAADKGVLQLTSAGDIAAGGTVMRIDVTGTPDADARMLEFDLAAVTDTNEPYGIFIDAGGKKVRALHIDADPVTNDVAYFHTDAAIADNKAVLSLHDAGEPAATGSNILRVEFAGTDTNKPTLVEIIGGGKDCKSLEIDSDPTTTSVASVHTDAVIADNMAVLALDSAGAMAAGSSILRLVNTGTPAAATSYTFEIDNSGMDSSNNPVCVRINHDDGTGAVIQATTAGTAANLLDLYSTNTGATGVKINTTHTSTGSAAAGDAILLVSCDGLDAGDGATEYTRLEAEIQDATAGQEDGRWIFSAAAHDSTMTQMLALNPRAGGALAEAVIGSGGGHTYVTSNGAYNLILDTNQGTTTGNITIEDGANGAITLTPNGSGAIDLVGKVLHSETTVSSGAGAVAVTGGIHEITTTGADALTLANGTEGQVLYVVMVADGGNGTLTPTSLAGGTNITFDDVGDAVTLLYTAAAWYIVGQNGVTVA